MRKILFIAKTRVRKRSNKDDYDFDLAEYQKMPKDILEWHVDIEPFPVMKLDVDFKKALGKMANIEELLQSLPGIDCGSARRQLAVRLRRISSWEE